MNMTPEKENLILEIAKSLIKNGKTLSFDELAKLLNSTGHKSSYDSSYNGGRGVAKLVSSVYKGAQSKGMKTEASNIAKAFTGKNGKFPWA